MKTENEDEKKITEAFGISEGISKNREKTPNSSEGESSSSTELSELRGNSNYPYCRGLITVTMFFQWIAVVVMFIAGILNIEGYSSDDRQMGAILMSSSIILAILNPYISHLTQLPFDIGDLLFEIKKNKTKLN